MIVQMLLTGSEAAGHAGEAVPFYLDTSFWVGVGFVLFLLLLFYLKVHKAAVSALDKRTEQISAQLAEASSLRASAESMLADATKRTEAAAGDVKAILESAEAEAAALVAKAEADGKAIVERRLRAAEEQITAAERNAVAALRARAADLAVAASAKIIAGSADAKTRSRLTDEAIAELDSRLN